MTIETYNQNCGIPMGAQSLASGGGGGTGGASINDNQVSTTTVYSSSKVESRLAEESSGTPTNMVTTDTEQTISGPKTFSGTLTASSGQLTVGVIGKKDGTINVGTSSYDSYVSVGKSNQGIGLTTNAGTSNTYFGIYSTGYTDQTFSISGHKNLNMRPSTSFSLSTVNRYCGVSADLSVSYPHLYLKGGNSASYPSGSVKIGYEGVGTYSNIRGTFIDTDSKKGPLLGKRLWIGEANYRASITNNIGSGVTIESDPLTAANNGIFTIGNNAVTFVGSDGVSHNLLDKGSPAESVPHRSARVAIPLTASGETITMPATGELRIRGSNGTSVNNYITIDLNPNGSDEFSKKVYRAPIPNATVSADVLVYEGQAVQIDYTATEVQAYVYLLLGDARAQGYDD